MDIRWNSQRKTGNFGSILCILLEQCWNLVRGNFATEWEKNHFKTILAQVWKSNLRHKLCGSSHGKGLIFLLRRVGS